MHDSVKIKNRFSGKTNLKLNLGCGKDIKMGFINIDYEEKSGVHIDLIADLSSEIPLEGNSAEFIYSSHMIEHLDWIEGSNFLQECFRCLESGGQLRLLFPNFKKIMTAYVNNDFEFFSDILDYLNNDYLYYQSMVDNPKEIIKYRKNNMPPSWHYSNNADDRIKVKLRAKKYKYMIECIDWFVHQYGEHVTLYDNEMIKGLLKDVGFKDVQFSKYDNEIDASNPIRVKTTSYITAYK